MKRVERAAREAKGQLFIPYIVAGDPTPEATVKLVSMLETSGAHIVELGVPYSDPLADGPTIQNAAKRALDGGMSLNHVFSLVEDIRARGVHIPIILFCYINPLLKYGIKDAIKKVKEVGVDGWLIPDLPFEENEEIKRTCQEHETELISLVAPTSKHRVQKIAEQAEGFLYCVSSLGVTGVRESLDPNLTEFVTTVERYSSVPMAVGFGISTREHVKTIHKQGYGAVVGSKIVSEINERNEALCSSQEQDEAIEEIKTIVQSLVSS
ncbi:LOW QUALITY PROTEIN: tryptophan synthase alpha chain [Geomicrobium sp. JCM 19039]|nr:LOW QUALITY PROTEIN: tryptophan synthase alpha chain [Geomicrobium sp. JCM 19039]